MEYFQRIKRFFANLCCCGGDGDVDGGEDDDLEFQSNNFAETSSCEESIDSREEFSYKDGTSIEISSNERTKADAIENYDGLEVLSDQELFDMLGVNVRSMLVDEIEPSTVDNFTSLGEVLTDDELLDMLQVNLKLMLTNKPEQTSVETFALSGEMLTDAELLDMLGVFDGPQEILTVIKKEQSVSEKEVCIAIDQKDPIAQVTKSIGFIMEHLADVFIDSKKRGSMLVDINDPKFDVVVDTLGLTNPCQIAYLDLIFDVSKEILVDLYQETQEVPQPWLKPKKLTPKPTLPCDKNKILPVLQKEVEKTLGLLPKDQTNAWENKRPPWSVMKLGCKDRDLVDYILIDEIREEEPDWINYDQEEVMVKSQIADSILDLLIDDTITTLKKIEENINGPTSSFP